MLKSISPSLKSKMIIIGTVVLIIAFFVLIVGEDSSGTDGKNQKSGSVNIITTEDPRSLGMDAISAKTLALEKKQQRIELENEKLKKELKMLSDRTVSTSKVENEINSLVQRDDSIQRALGEQLKKNKKELEIYFENLMKRSPILEEERLRWVEMQKQHQKELKEQLEVGKGNANAKTSSKPSSKEVDIRQNLSQSENIKAELKENSLIKRRPSNGSQSEITFPKFEYGKPATSKPKGDNRGDYDKSYLESRTPALMVTIESSDENVAAKGIDDIKNSKEIYLPQGAILTGVLITGMDAPTSESAQETPYPALVRIKKEAILPNLRTMNEVKECFALLGGYGKLSTERVMMRGEAISCVKKDGSVIESKLSGYAVGEDAKAGLKGRLVTRNSRVLVNAMLSGFAGSMAQIFNVAPVETLGLTADGVPEYREILDGKSLQGGVAQGASSAMERLADFYLDLAESMHPSIEISSGRIINIVLTRGNSM